VSVINIGPIFASTLIFITSAVKQATRSQVVYTELATHYRVQN